MLERHHDVGVGVQGPRRSNVASNGHECRRRSSYNSSHRTSVRSLTLPALALVGCASHPPPTPTPRRTTAPPAREVELVDDFRDADGSALNVSLAARQRGTAAPVRWSRLPGVWFAAPVPGDAASQVRDGRLYFTANSAARLEHAWAPREGGYSLRFRADPVGGNRTSLGWISVVLQTSPDALGWVNENDAVLGFLVRSNGEVNVATRGEPRTVHWRASKPEAADGYVVALTLRVEDETQGARLVLDGEVDGRRFAAVLGEGSGALLPPRVWLAFGAHFHPGDEPVSWIDDVAVHAAP